MSNSLRGTVVMHSQSIYVSQNRDTMVKNSNQIACIVNIKTKTAFKHACQSQLNSEMEYSIQALNEYYYSQKADSHFMLRTCTALPGVLECMTVHYIFLLQGSWGICGVFIMHEIKHYT